MIRTRTPALGDIAMTLLRRSAALASIAALAACSNPTHAAEQGRMVRQRQIWNAKDIDDYRMTVHMGGGMIGGAAVIEVRDGVPVSVQPVETGPGQLPVSAFARYDTVEELFGILEDAFKTDVDRIDAEYHARYGLPVSVFIDPREDVADEEHGFLVKGFTAL